MGSRRVLILDDDRAYAPRLTDWFKRFQHGYDYEIVTAGTVSETLSALAAGRPDLVIVEPETDGFDSLDIVSKLRKHDRKIPIIAASKGKKREAAEAMFQLGLFAYMPKPLDFVPLEHVVAMAFAGA
jgi:DNA-binding NtrC family response regulator